MLEPNWTHWLIGVFQRETSTVKRLRNKADLLALSPPVRLLFGQRSTIDEDLYSKVWSADEADQIHALNKLADATKVEDLMKCKVFPRLVFLMGRPNLSKIAFHLIQEIRCRSPTQVFMALLADSKGPLLECICSADISVASHGISVLYESVKVRLQTDDREYTQQLYTLEIRQSTPSGRRLLSALSKLLARGLRQATDEVPINHILTQPRHYCFSLVVQADTRFSGKIAPSFTRPSNYSHPFLSMKLVARV